jgi:hypothetical protein
MPLATAADIALGTRAQQVRTQENSTVKTQYPTRARDGNLRPDAGYFDVVTDADTILTARAALIGVWRSRFAVEVEGMIWFDPVAFAGVRLVDAEKSVDATFMVARWQIDTEAERTRFELYG